MLVISESFKLRESPLPDEWDDDIKNKINIKTEPSLQSHLDIMSKSLSDKEALLKQLENKEGKFNQYGKGTSRIAYHIENGSQKNTIIKFAYNEKGLAQNGQELKVLLSSEVVNASQKDSCIIRMIDYDKDSDVFQSTGNPIWIQLEPIVTYKVKSSQAEEVFKNTYKCSPEIFNSFLDIKKNEIELYTKKVFALYDSEWKEYYKILLNTYKDQLDDTQLKQFCLFVLLLGISSELNLKKVLITNYHKKNLLGILEKMKPLLHLYNIKQNFNLVSGDISGIHNWGYRPKDKDKPIIFDLGLSEDILYNYYMFQKN